jgi:hypothetical protein
MTTTKHINIYRINCLLITVFLLIAFSAFSQTVTVDEVSIVAYEETTTIVPVGYGYNNLGPYVVHGKIWVFYSDGTNAYWRTKLLGPEETWTARRFLFEESQGAFLNVAFDGTYFHFIRQINDVSGWGDLEYRRGKAESDGSITFDNETVIFSDPNWKVSNRHFSVYSDESENLWLMVKVYNSGINRYKSIVLSSIGGNGTWINRPGFPKDLSDESSSDLNGRGPKIIQIDTGKILFSWRNHNSGTGNYGMRARLWTQNTNNPDDEGQLGDEENTLITSSLSKSGETSIVSPDQGIAMINSGKYVSRRNGDGAWQRVDPPSGIIEDDELRSNSLSVKNGTVRIWDINENDIRYSETSNYGTSWSNIVVRTTSESPSHLSASHGEGSKGSFHGILWRAGDSPYDIGMSIDGDYYPFDDYTEPPSEPLLVSPEDGSTDLPVSVTLRWLSVENAESYRVQIALHPGMDAPVADSDDITDTEFDILLEHDTMYFWRVNASNLFGTSDWSSVWSFRTIIEKPVPPVLVTPLDGSINVSVAPTLVWESAPFAETYHIQVATTPDYSVLIIDNPGITDTFLSLSNLDHDTEYYWRVRSQNVAGESDWSTFWTFRTAVPIAETPMLVSPENGSVNIATDTVLVWNESEGTETYSVQISTNIEFSGIVIDTNGITDTDLAVFVLENSVTYFWRVRAENAGGISNWSSVWNFTTIAQAPDVPVLAFPQNGEINIAVDTVLVWETAARAESYHTQVSTDSEFSTVILDSNSVTNSHLAVNGLDSMTTYYWRVKAKNNGGESNWSQVWNFTTENVTNVDSVDINIPHHYALSQNYPNPFNPGTTIRYSVPDDVYVRLVVYNVLGQLVTELVNGEMNAGSYEVTFDAGNLPSGIYIYHLTAGYYFETKRMILTK